MPCGVQERFDLLKATYKNPLSNDDSDEEDAVTKLTSEQPTHACMLSTLELPAALRWLRKPDRLKAHLNILVLAQLSLSRVSFRDNGSHSQAT